MLWGPGGRNPPALGVGHLVRVWVQRWRAAMRSAEQRARGALSRFLQGLWVQLRDRSRPMTRPGHPPPPFGPPSRISEMG